MSNLTEVVKKVCLAVTGKDYKGNVTTIIMSGSMDDNKDKIEGWIPVAESSVIFNADLSTEAVNKATIDNLKVAIKKEKAEHVNRINRLQENIDNLLTLPSVEESFTKYKGTSE